MKLLFLLALFTAIYIIEGFICGIFWVIEVDIPERLHLITYCTGCAVLVLFLFNLLFGFRRNN